jgi:hypothetical protein
MANSRKRISELPPLSPASLDTTFVVGISGSTTYKISINNLTSSLDTTFATDLVTSALSNTLDTKLSTSSFNSYTSSFTASVASGTISGSSQISALGFVTGSYTTINSFNSLTQSFNSISQSFSVISGSVGTVDFTTFATTGSNTFIGNQTITGSVGIRANSGSWNFRTDGTLVLPNGTGIYGNGLLQVDTVGGFLLTSYTDQIGGGSQEWYFHSDGILNVPGNIEGADNLLTTSSFNSYTASQSTSSLVDRLNTIESVSGSWITESETGSFLTSLSGAISSSSQLTSSYDTRYTLSGSVQPLPSNLLSSSAQITAFGFISSSTTIDTGSFNSIGFNTSAGVSVGVGELAWNNTDGTLDLGMKGGNVVQQIGQEIFYEVRNETGIQIPNGTAVYANGVTAGSGRITAAPYVADGSIRENRFLGIATENISTGVNGFVTHFGYVRDLDTRGTTASSIAVGDETWAVGDILYVHPTVAGKLTKVKPQHEVTVAIVITRHQSAGVIFVRPSSSGHLGDIHDISINTGSLSNGQVLSYNSTTGVWENTNTISGSSQLTSSYDARYTLSSSFSSISSSFNSRFNGLVTTGSNTFSGSQIFSGSMVVTSGQIIASAITNNSSSLFLQSGSNLYVQNNGLVEITGSLKATSITGSIAATNGVISGSTQLTTAFPSKTTGAWSVPAGASTQSFTVEAGASYTMWVNGNIPNGIITWNATVTTSNTNVPVVGSQYGWYYTAGNALVLTAMPDQIIGTTNTLISSPASYAPNTSNVFKFGITNNSGTTQTINYGYIKLS